MNISEKRVFEDVLANTGFSIVSNNDGLYELSHSSSSGTSLVQTNGYNLWKALQDLARSSVAKGILS